MVSKTAANASAGDCVSKLRSWGMPKDWPRIQTSAWSATVIGLVRKKKPRVMWKSEREVRIVVADMSAMVRGYSIVSSIRCSLLLLVCRPFFLPSSVDDKRADELGLRIFSACRSRVLEGEKRSIGKLNAQGPTRRREIIRATGLQACVV